MTTKSGEHVAAGVEEQVATRAGEQIAPGVEERVAAGAEEHVAAGAEEHVAAAGEHIVGYRTLAGVWLALLALTAATVLVSRVDLGAGKVWAALAVACLKSGLVIAFFMHMKYEARLFRVILFVALVTLAIFIGLTFFDVLYR